MFVDHHGDEGSLADTTGAGNNDGASVDGRGVIRAVHVVDRAVCVFVNLNVSYRWLILEYIIDLF